MTCSKQSLYEVRTWEEKGLQIIALCSGWLATLITTSDNASPCGILGISSDTHVLWSDISHIAFGDDHHSATTANFLNIPRSVGMLHKHSVAIRLSLLHINCHLKVKRQCQAGFKQQGACIQKAYSILATPVFLSWIFNETCSIYILRAAWQIGK